MLFVAILTPAGRGAVATVALRGTGAVAAVEPHFAAASGRSLAEVARGRLQFGRWHSGGAAEEIVAVVLGPDEVELHCHGGPAAAAAIVAALVAAGAAPLSWQQWLERFDEPLAAECRVALAHAATERTCAILLDQWRGALAAELAQIDELLAAADAARRADARQRLARLVALGQTIGPHLTAPWRVVIAGQPNVGKSSLINALLGYQRSIVFDQPGTTRDALSAFTAIDGWPVELVDTAGLRAAADPLEAAGIAVARQQLAAADAVVLVADVTADLSDPPIASTLLVGNKADLLAAGERRAWQDRHPDGLLLSARTGEGIGPLCGRLSRALVPLVPQPGQAVPFTPRQWALVRSRHG